MTMTKKVAFVDIDDTLVHNDIFYKEDDDSDYVHHNLKLQGFDFHFIERPDSYTWLRSLACRYEVHICTSAQPDYAAMILEHFGYRDVDKIFSTRLSAYSYDKVLCTDWEHFDDCGIGTHGWSSKTEFLKVITGVEGTYTHVIPWYGQVPAPKLPEIRL